MLDRVAARSGGVPQTLAAEDVTGGLAVEAVSSAIWQVSYTSSNWCARFAIGCRRSFTACIFSQLIADGSAVRFGVVLPLSTIGSAKVAAFLASELETPRHAIGKSIFGPIPAIETPARIPGLFAEIATPLSKLRGCAPIRPLRCIVLGEWMSKRRRERRG